MLLSVEDLHVAYGPIEALHGITFNVKEGEMVTLIGANGAGKSTTLMSIMRLPPPEAPLYRSGRMTFQGQDLTRFSLQKEIDFRRQRCSFRIDLDQAGSSIPRCVGQ